MTVDVAAQFEQARVLLAYAARIGRVVDPTVRSELIRLERVALGGSAVFADEQSLNDQCYANFVGSALNGTGRFRLPVLGTRPAYCRRIDAATSGAATVARSRCRVVRAAGCRHRTVPAR